VSLPAVRRATAELERDALLLDRALSRATGARPVPGNSVRVLQDGPAVFQEMLRLIRTAKRWVHFENYIIRDDQTGWRFAEALGERAAAGVKVRVLYDHFGSFGTGWGFWHHLRNSGVDVRAFHRIPSLSILDTVRRDHRKLVVGDGCEAVIGGLCIGDEWTGDPARGRQPWRDTAALVCGPAAAALDHAFGRMWARAGSPLPPEELESEPEECGTAAVRVVDGLPRSTRAYRAEQLIAAGVASRLWITDAYLVAPAPLFAGLIAAARDGVDVRLLLPGTSDLPVIRWFTRVGYRDLLRAGARIYEWRGPMLHAKTSVADGAWTRIGSSNLNVSSLIGNYELDILVEDPTVASDMTHQFRRDLGGAVEMVLRPRRLQRLPHAVRREPASQVVALERHARSRREIGYAAVVAVRQAVGGTRRSLLGFGAFGLAGVGVLFLTLPKLLGTIVAVGCFWLSVTALVAFFQRRRSHDA
jgi:cardiolipin synthase A/B